jgi:hypothetical protein
MFQSENEFEQGLYALVIEALTQSSPDPSENVEEWRCFQEAYLKIKERWPNLNCNLFEFVQHSKSSVPVSIEDRFRFNMIDNEMQKDSKVAQYVMSVARQVSPGGRLAYGMTLEYFEDHPLFVIYEKLGPLSLNYLFTQTTVIREGVLEPEFGYFPFPRPGSGWLDIQPYEGKVVLLSESTDVATFDRETLEELLTRDVKVFKDPDFEHAEEYFAVRFPSEGTIKVIITNNYSFFQKPLQEVLELVKPLHTRTDKTIIKEDNKIVPDFIVEPTSHFNEVRPLLKELNSCITKPSKTKEKDLPSAEICVYQMLLEREISEVIRKSNFFRYGLLKILSREEVYNKFFLLYAGTELKNPRYRFYLFVASLLRMKVDSKLLCLLITMFNYVISEEVWKNLYEGHAY